MTLISKKFFKGFAWELNLSLLQGLWPHSQYLVCFWKVNQVFHLHNPQKKYQSMINKNLKPNVATDLFSRSQLNLIALGIARVVLNVWVRAVILYSLTFQAEKFWFLVIRPLFLDNILPLSKPRLYVKEDKDHRFMSMPRKQFYHFPHMFSVNITITIIVF